MPYARLLAAPTGAAREVGMVLGQLAEGGGLGNFAAALLHALPTPAFVVLSPVNGQVIGTDDAGTVAALKAITDAQSSRRIWRPDAGQAGRILLWSVDPASTLDDAAGYTAAIDQPQRISRSTAAVLNILQSRGQDIAGNPLLVLDQADGSVQLLDWASGDPFAVSLAGRSIHLQAVRTKRDV